MKYFFFFILVITFSLNSLCQSQGRINERDISLMAEDTNKVNALNRIAESYYFSKPDSCFFWSEQSVALSRKLGFIKGLITSLQLSAEALRFMGDFPKAIQYNLEALQLNREIKNKEGEAGILGFLALDYIEFREYKKGLDYALRAFHMIKETSNKVMTSFNCSQIGYAYDLLGNEDSALIYQLMALKYSQGLKHGPLNSMILSRVGNIYARKEQKDSAFYYYRLSLENAYRVNDEMNKSNAQLKISELFEKYNQFDSSLYYARLAFDNGLKSSQKLEMLETSELLSRLYKREMNLDSAYFYEVQAGRMRTELFGPEKFRHLQLIMLEEQEKRQLKEKQQQDYINRAKFIALISAAIVFLVIGFLLWNNSRRNRKAKNKVEKAYEELKAAQQQLVHREKMASLGELTSGIAHEIQNPLNFVNNFSELNQELLSELKQSVAGDQSSNQEDSAIELTNAIIENEDKILFHGKRAGAIVKSMLLHSRSTGGELVNTDLNTLIEEYVKLGLASPQARTDRYDIRITRNYDPLVGEIKIIPQEIGRVILNVINNALYAIKEKTELADFTLESNNYKPEISITTQKIADGVLIMIKDNGRGIPEKIKDKVMQPFFTTKPAGQGTGLGLSLSYDIIKFHKGGMQINSKNQEYTEVLITLPSNNN